jgi:L-lactate dehydrogenase
VLTGIPVLLNNQGVKEVVEIDMIEEELTNFEASNNIIRENIAKLKIN